MDKYQQEEHGLKAIEEQIARHMVGIVYGSGAHKWEGIGTGCLIEWNRRFLILTADHVIKDTSPEDLRFFFRPDDALQESDREMLQSLRGASTRSLKPFNQLDLISVVESPGFDIAALEIKQEIEKHYPAQFFTLGTGGATPPVDSPLVLIGFPYDISRLTFDDKRVAFTSIEWTKVGQNQNYLGNFDPESHLLAPYITNEEYPDGRPHGSSGAGVWTLEKVPAPQVWYPKIELAGLTIGYFKKPQLLQSVRREAIEHFLGQHFR